MNCGTTEKVVFCTSEINFKALISQHRGIKLVPEDNLDHCAVGYYSNVHCKGKTPKVVGCCQDEDWKYSMKGNRKT